MSDAHDLGPEPGWTEVRPFPFAAARQTFTAGDYEADRLQIRYFRRSDGALVAKVWFGPRSEGAPGHVHGGGLLTVLDEAMGAAGWLLGHPVMTVHLNATFRRQVPVGATLLVETEIVETRSRALTVRGRMTDPGGQVRVEGEGVFALLRPEKVREIFGLPA